MPNAMKQPVRTHLSAEEQERLGQEATARGISISQCIRECLAEYFALRAEVATAFETPGRPGEPRTGLIHTLLARTEARLARRSRHARRLSTVSARMSTLSSPCWIASRSCTSSTRQTSRRRSVRPRW